MSVSIAQELTTFKEKVSPALGTVSSLLTTLTSKLTDLNRSTKTAVSSLSANYNGDGLSTAVSAFNSIDAAVEGIKASLPEGPEQAVSMSTELIADITALEEKKTLIDKLEEELKSFGGKWTVNAEGTNQDAVNAHNRQIDNKEAEIASKETEFKADEEKCKTKLAAIKALNPELDISVKNQTVDLGGDVMVDLQTLTPGSYQTLEYTGKNGRKVKYSIYVPANANTTEGLPVHVYMGGSGEVGKMNAGGLAKLLSEGQQSSGIVVVLEADHSNAYVEDRYLDASKELIDNVVTTYKADTNRISVSGHSLGGIGTLHMAERFPGYFSVVAPVSGYNNQRGKQSSNAAEAYEKLKKERIVAVTGRSDTNSYNSMNVLNTRLKDGGNMQFITVSGGHRIQFKMYGEQVEVNGKTYANWLEFCLAQTKSTDTTTA